GPARNASSLCLAEPVMRGLTFDVAHLLAGTLVLVSPRTLSGPTLCTAEHVRAPCLGVGALSSLAGLHPKCTAPLRDRGDCAHLQGDHHPRCASPHHRAPRYSPRDRKGGRRWLRHAAGHGLGRAFDGGDVARDG